MFFCLFSLGEAVIEAKDKGTLVLSTKVKKIILFFCFFFLVVELAGQAKDKGTEIFYENY